MNDTPTHFDLEPASVSTLIGLSQDGATAAREALFSRLRHDLETVASRYLDGDLRQRLAVSDVVQIAFVRILECFHQFSGTTSLELRAWIRTIVKNEIHHARDFHRAKKRDVRSETSLERTPGVSAPGDRQLTPSSQAIVDEHSKIMEAILRSMSKDDRQVIELRSLDGLSFREIGKTMHRSEQAASQLWYRAIVRFGEALQRHGFEAPS